MKELNAILLGKGLFVSIKVQLSLTKGHLGNQEGKAEIGYPPRQKFLTLLIQIKKNFFSKRRLFNEMSDPRTLYFSKIDPGRSLSHRNLRHERVKSKHLENTKCFLYYFPSNSKLNPYSTNVPFPYSLKT